VLAVTVVEDIVVPLMSGRVGVAVGGAAEWTCGTAVEEEENVVVVVTAAAAGSGPAAACAEWVVWTCSCCVGAGVVPAEEGVNGDDVAV
jgi:hypothetical protein